MKFFVKIRIETEGDLIKRLNEWKDKWRMLEDNAEGCKIAMRCLW